MTSFFRIATKQAIRDIITENAQSLKFGVAINDDSLENITEKVVDLFEMTLELRARSQNFFGPMLERQEPAEEPKQKRFTRYNATTVKASYHEDEVIDVDNSYKEDSFLKDRPLLIPAKEKSTLFRTFTPHKLPRNKTELSYEEREKLMSR
jgi:hypothetical protein